MQDMLHLTRQHLSHDSTLISMLEVFGFNMKMGERIGRQF